LSIAAAGITITFMLRFALHVQGLTAIHVAVLLFGMSGFLGRMVVAPAVVIVFGRAAIAATVLGALLFFRKPAGQGQIASNTVYLLVSGVILAVHWLTFFHAIQISTVAVALLAFSSFPLFTTLIEPLVFRQRVRLFDVAMTLLVFAGLVLVITAFNFGNQITRGAIWGTISGLTFAVLAVLNRKYAQRLPPLVIAAGQNAVAAMVLLPLMPSWLGSATAHDLWLIGVIGLFCTAIAHWCFIRGLADVKAQAAALIASLEPVYGILLAILFLNEVPSPRTLLGGCIIVGASTIVSLSQSGNGDKSM
jgi:drug/metabolite transporter (DMT)-like permease